MNEGPAKGAELNIRALATTDSSVRANSNTYNTAPTYSYFQRQDNLLSVEFRNPDGSALSAEATRDLSERTQLARDLAYERLKPLAQRKPPHQGGLGGAYAFPNFDFDSRPYGGDGNYRRLEFSAGTDSSDATTNSYYLRNERMDGGRRDGDVFVASLLDVIAMKPEDVVALRARTPQAHGPEAFLPPSDRN